MKCTSYQQKLQKLNLNFMISMKLYAFRKKNKS